ncbi:MAG: RICIN domain-containing protein [Actinomycetota bacterium]|nr:RICIN domain-containing protein [Actinomycetota bacterium]
MADVGSNRASGRAPTRRSGAALSVALLITAFTGLSTAPARGGVTPVAFEIDAIHSGKAMDVFEASEAPGAAIVQWTPNGGDNQAWRVLPFSSVGDLDLVIIQSVHSGLVLDVVDHSTADAARLTQSNWEGHASQLWIVYPFGETDLSLIVNVNSGKVADVMGASTANGAGIIQWPWHGGANQLWAFLV